MRTDAAEAKRYWDLNNANLGASHIIWQIDCLYQCDSRRYQTQPVCNDGGCAHPRRDVNGIRTNNFREGRSLRVKLAARCFYSRGNKTAVAPVMHAIEATQENPLGG